MTLLSPAQQAIVEAPLDSKWFVSGRAGTGKTTAAIQRLRFLIESGVPADSILLLAPQRTLQEPYRELLLSPQRPPGGETAALTIGGLAKRACELFWLLAAEEAGFKHPDQPPIFLTLETAQYYMARLARPKLEEGFFQSVSIDRNRLYSQILDNLNKSAVVGFPYTEIGARLEAAWFGDPEQRNIYRDAQACATLFRQYCLENNLLDFSLQLEVFASILWRKPEVRDYLRRNYRHLIYDNVEEDGARAHDLLAEWLPEFDSALLIYDEAAGYRYFLGGDAATGYELRNLCEEHLELNESFVCSPQIIELSEALTAAITRQQPPPAENPAAALDYVFERYYTEMLDKVADKAEALVAKGTPPGEIVILAPFLSDALRFAIAERLEKRGVPWRSHRPSRSLRDEPASAALLTLSALAHPAWNMQPAKFDVARALMFALNMDLIRAQLLTEIAYRQGELRSFDIILPEMQQRVTYVAGERYENLRNWIRAVRESEPIPLDFFLRKLFGEVLSQPDYGFHANLDAARVAASLVEATRKFRRAMEAAGMAQNSPENILALGREYLVLLQEGLIAAQYLEAWRAENLEAVLIAPAHTFLMMNRPAAAQFWLDPGASGWSQRLAQPLTHPYVLSRGWEAGRLWTDADEARAEVESLARLTGGLLARCRERVVLALAELSETGFEQRGLLLKAFQKVAQRSAA